MYLFVCSFVCLFVRSLRPRVVLTNCLTQALKNCIDDSVNSSWSSEHTFNFLRFVIQKLLVFLKNELNDLEYASKYQNMRGHSSLYVTEGGLKC